MRCETAKPSRLRRSRHLRSHLAARDNRCESLPAHPAITAVTLAELSLGPLVATSDSERAARLAHLQQAEADFEPIPFDADAARAFGRVAAALRLAGHKRRARAFDAMIAATAVANHLPVYTCNPADFAGVEGLEVIPIRLAEGRCR